MISYDPYQYSNNYFDYNASTPCDDRVLEAMMPYMTYHYGNPHSRSHIYGWNAKHAIEEARDQIAKAIKAEAREIIFTSGATESVNMAIYGVVKYKNINNPHIITSMIEHKCVIEAAFSCAQVTLIKPSTKGIINIEDIRKAIQDNTILVSIGYVNGEIGTIQDIDSIGQMCQEHNILFHTDAAQALGKIDIDIRNVDLLSLSSHKAYGPKGIGCLYIKKKTKIKPIIFGGGQERNLRGGTLPTALCVGFGKAASIIDLDIDKMNNMHNKFYSYIMSHLDHVYLNGDAQQRVPHNINLSFAYIEGESLIMKLQDIAVSSGSACTSASLEPSYVLRAIGVKDLLAHSSLRISFGRFTNLENLMQGAEKIVKSVKELREISPLVEMAEQGIDLDHYEWNIH